MSNVYIEVPLKIFLKTEGLQLELISPVDITSVKASIELRGRALSQDEINELMTVCFSDAEGGKLCTPNLLVIPKSANIPR
ncbi:MAG: hypothetical protein HWQ38_14645 [Nostoc sp. NMS7]|uniref:hypothetical protein n=1 Tax=unclassified Nostoc TaxID=2593658 RepID=UPI0025CE4E10|nr:hypothetical protein [Nostoc sp. NMS7]MBN3947622.1 hypothetical protein [Nostoc sp. NMS7]